MGFPAHARSYGGVRVDVPELLDERLLALHDRVIRGATPARSGWTLRGCDSTEMPLSRRR